MTSPAGDTTLFHDLDVFVGHPQLSGLALSPDGGHLMTTVSTRNAKGTGSVSALWDIDPSGDRPARRLTQGVEGESAPAFTHAGDLFFTSTRPTGTPAAQDQEKAEASLWQLPAQGGEARLVLSRPGGVGSVTCAQQADVTLVSAPLLPGAADEDQHARVHTARTSGGVDAILHTGYPIRFWDHDLGPHEPQVFTLDPDEQLQHVSAGLDASLREQEPQVSPNGLFALSTAAVPEARAEQRTVLLRIDLATGAHTRIVDEPGCDVESVLISPDSTQAIIGMSAKSTPDSAPRPVLWRLDLETGARTALAHDWDRWPTPAAWLADCSAVLALADEDGRGPVFSIDVATGSVRTVTRDDATYSSVVTPIRSEQTGVAYGVRSSPAYPAEVVRIDLASGEVDPLPGPAERPALPGRLSEVATTTPDGVRVRGWLALPEAGNGPAPLLVFIHGGPLSSWNAWTWRWNPWVMVARGYAVLLPDPALSTGYGQDFIQRGWGAWGGAPFTDLMALTDEVVARDDIDAERTAALGGSFGGYMANWIVGHTDRFAAIVTHASLWALDGFGPTTDASFYWRREMTEQMALDNSPHRFVGQIATPMLVIHGDKDYRVPINEGLRLWYELLATSGLPAQEDGSTVHRFLYFPHENHWILAPQHAKIWYEVVTGFLDEHVLGAPAGAPPEVLGLTPPTPGPDSPSKA